MACSGDCPRGSVEPIERRRERVHEHECCEGAATFEDSGRMTQEDVAQLAASLVLERVARRLYNAGAVDELRCLSRMSAQEIDILVELERADGTAA